MYSQSQSNVSYPQNPPPPYTQDPFYGGNPQQQQQNYQVSVDPLDTFPTLIKWILKIGMVIGGAVAIINGIVGFFFSLFSPLCLISNIILM